MVTSYAQLSRGGGVPVSLVMDRTIHLAILTYLTNSGMVLCWSVLTGHINSAMMIFTLRKWFEGESTITSPAIDPSSHSI